jgi:cytochrome oxidase Cu insertion factor (SCO1/SenC/PrrC family)
MSGMGGSPGAGGALIVQAFHDALLRQGGIIFLVVILLLVGWNGLRSLQYRRAVARGESYPRPHPAPAVEPLARRVLRIGFGAFWVVDGLLQLQPQMPLGLPTSALTPAAAGSPGWVQSLVGFGVTAWTRHPAEAAAATVWIQLGIGILLWVAPLGRWSRAAGLVSVGWGLVVWVFGEAFGGLFAPGLTFLFGAPGGVLFYVAGGALLALPDRAWTGRRLGLVVTRSFGVLLLALAVLQAWPGRGFWQGTQHGRPATLAGMVEEMAATPQPHALASTVSWFGSFDQAHGWLVNLVAVVLLAGIGAVFLRGRRYLYPALIALIVFGVVDWVLIEDLGVFGGTGTDPNSMLPALLLAVGGYVALTRAPAELPAAVPLAPVDTPLETPLQRAGAGAPDPGPSTGPPARRPWWERIDPGYAGRLAAAVGAVFVVLVGTAPMVAASLDRHADPLLAQSVNGAPTVVDSPAPGFHLVDQSGQPLSLGDLRGHTVALTFLDPVCTSDCPVIAQEFRQADQLLGAQADGVRFVAVDANPAYLSVASLDAFDEQEGLDRLANWRYVTGPLGTLQTVWDDYGAGVYLAPAGGMAVHSDIVYVIDSRGHLRRVINADPGGASAADQSSFAGVLVQQISQVMHS